MSGRRSERIPRVLAAFAGLVAVVVISFAVWRLVAGTTTMPPETTAPMAAPTTEPPVVTTTTRIEATTTTTTTTMPRPGDVDEEDVLQALQTGCAAGDYAMCDILYLASPFFSEYEAFGDSCGDRIEPAGWCVDEFDVPVDLTALRAACGSWTSMLACDMLYAYSPFGSDDEAFGASCGGREKTTFACVTEHGLP